MRLTLLHYGTIAPGLVERLIPDYGLRMDSQRLLRRGTEIKIRFPELSDWPGTILAKAEIYQEEAGRADSRILPLSLPEFLTLLFKPVCRVGLAAKNRAVVIKGTDE